jgi:hypothetical protein
VKLAVPGSRGSPFISDGTAVQSSSDCLVGAGPMSPTVIYIPSADYSHDEGIDRSKMDSIDRCCFCVVNAMVERKQEMCAF